MCFIHKMGILFNFKKEGNSDTGYNMDEHWGHYAQWNKPVTEKQILPGSTYVSYLVKIIKTK